MKMLFTIISSFLTCGLLAQIDRPNDFYVTKSGDTIYGNYTPAFSSKVDIFKNLKGEKIKIKPDSIRTYSIYLENTNRMKGDPFYFSQSWLNIRDTFYEIIYKGTGPVSVLRFKQVKNVLTTYGMPHEYFERNGILTAFSMSAFYSECKKYMADCPSIVDLLDHVPNDKKSTKTHKAKLEDVEFVVSKYNECVKK